ncbi:MAG: J domain-containing protein [Proteobacteria bacterium]|nr:J domain-containing protein [Pseudomonadota bacterium]
MARETDFLDLYKILGVQPDCELSEFKQAYRRRVLVLHPDRRGSGHSDLIANERLQRLTALYGAAMRFERQHGRLPGAPAARQVDRSAARAGFADSLPKNRAKQPVQRSRWLLAATLGAGAGWLWWNNNPPVPASAPPTAATKVSATKEKRESSSLALPAQLQLGMDSKTVRKLEGDPVMINGSRWDYGPSWIRFENDHVVDWYSSQLQPLKASRAPGEAVSL